MGVVSPTSRARRWLGSRENPFRARIQIFDGAVHRPVGRGGGEPRRDALSRRAELADVRHRLDTLTERRLLADWTDDEAIEYAVLSMRERELLAQGRRRGVRDAPGRDADPSTAWSVARRQA